MVAKIEVMHFRLGKGKGGLKGFQTNFETLLYKYVTI